jgi:hypothetical protein
MVYTGHITRGTRRAAREREGKEVLCLECLAPTELVSLDCGFDDQFGGVTDWRSVTKCCEGEDYRDIGCDNCGMIVAVEKYGDNLLCEHCIVEAREEDGDVDHK